MLHVAAINSILLIDIIAKLLSCSKIKSFGQYKAKNVFLSSRKNGENIYAKNTKLKVLNFCLLKTVNEQTLEQSH